MIPEALTMESPQRVGSRRDKEIGELRRRVQELEDVVDEMAGALAIIRRWAQTQPTYPTNPMEGS